MFEGFKSFKLIVPSVVREDVGAYFEIGDATAKHVED